MVIYSLMDGKMKIKLLHKLLQRTVSAKILPYVDPSITIMANDFRTKCPKEGGSNVKIGG